MNGGNDTSKPGRDMDLLISIVEKGDGSIMARIFFNISPHR